MRIQLDMFGNEVAARVADIEAGRLEPVTSRDAATVLVLREVPPEARGGYGPSGSGVAPGGTVSPRGMVDGAPDTMAPFAIGRDIHDIQALMLRRTARMKFAPGAYVFPGGSVDPADYDADAGWHGPSPEEFGVRLGANAEVARALVWAAIRETFEESGILLAAPSGDDPVVVPSGPSWDADRLALVTGQLSMTELLSRRGLVVRADLLVPWARWITPVGESRRFDARFFAAALPDGQEAVGHEAEADHVTWLLPASAVDAAKAGELSLLPPTATILHELAVAAGAGRGLAGLLGAPRVIEPVQPQMILEDGSVWLVIPDEVGCPL